MVGELLTTGGRVVVVLSGGVVLSTGGVSAVVGVVVDVERPGMGDSVTNGLAIDVELLDGGGIAGAELVKG